MDTGLYRYGKRTSLLLKRMKKFCRFCERTAVVLGDEANRPALGIVEKEGFDPPNRFARERRRLHRSAQIPRYAFPAQRNLYESADFDRFPAFICKRWQRGAQNGDFVVVDILSLAKYPTVRKEITVLWRMVWKRYYSTIVSNPCSVGSYGRNRTIRWCWSR